MLTGDLDNDFLICIGGAESNSLTNILQSDIDEYQPQIISHSPYYHHDTLAPVLSKSENAFSILSSNIQSVNAQFDELNIFYRILEKYSLYLVQYVSRKVGLLMMLILHRLSWRVILVFLRVGHVVVKVG